MRLQLAIFGAIFSLCVIAISCAPNKAQKLGLPKMFDFQQFKSLFKRNYKSIVEELRREKIFLGRAFRAFISYLNYKQRKRDFFLKVSVMSDWTNAEHKSILKRRPLSQMKGRQVTLDAEDDLEETPTASLEETLNMKARRRRDLSAQNEPKQIGLFQRGSRMLGSFMNEAAERNKRNKTDLPDEVFADHRKSGCLQEPRLQGFCGSCYIFSTTALYEWQYCHESGKKVAFSEQYPLDCGDKIGLKGCGMGSELLVGDFYGYFGLEARTDYSYFAQSYACPYSESTNPSEMGRYKLTRSDGGIIGVQLQYLQKFLNKGPIIMGVGVPDTFSDYGGGVDDGFGCDLENGHSMLMVGSGREDGQEYWLFRNSYGESWGLDGYYKLNKEATNCFYLDDGAGIGFFLYAGKNATIFHKEQNANYNENHIKKRQEAILNQIPIEHNPITYMPELDMRVVAPKALID